MFVASLLRGTRPFVGDTVLYWQVNLANVRLQEAADASLFYRLRGVLGSITYAPAAVGTAIAGESLAGFFVLLQNAILIACVAAVVLPRVVAPWRTVHARLRWVIGVMAWVVLQGFAPYALLDLYSLAAVLVAIILLGAGRGWKLFLAGILLGYSINIRPAFLPFVVLLLVVAAIFRRWRSGWVLLGAAVATIPQIALNAIRYRTFGMSPVSTDELVALQASYASFTVRYDTVVVGMGGAPQFYCSPSMAGAVDPLPMTTWQLLMTYVHTLPTSALFVAEKIGAALHWQASTPYFVESPGVDALFALAVTAIAVIGCTALVVGPLLRRARTSLATWEAWGLATAVLLASIVTLAGSTPEARFALPLVMYGVVGIVVLVDLGWRRVLDHRRTVVLTALAVVLVFGVGYVGLAHPAAQGIVTIADCRPR